MFVLIIAAITFFLIAILFWPILIIGSQQSIEEERMHHSMVFGDVGTGKGSFQKLLEIDDSGNIVEVK